MSHVERQERIAELLPLVRRIAGRVQRMVPRTDLGDLIGDGCIGLVRAVDAYDPTRGTLVAFARRLIAGSMLNGLRRMDPVSERVRRSLRRIEDERLAIAVSRGVMPSRHEMEQRYPQLRRLTYAAYCSLPLSLDAPLPLGERLRADRTHDPATIAGQQDERAYLRSLVEALPPRERRVMLAHYYGTLSLRRIGVQFSISSQRASQLHLSALRRLRRALRATAH